MVRCAQPLGNLVDQRNGMELERPMQQRIIAITGNIWIEATNPVFHVMHQLQGEVGMQALIMMQRLIAQAPETQHGSQQNNPPKWRPIDKLLARRWHKAPLSRSRSELLLMGSDRYLLSRSFLSARSLLFFGK